MRLTTYFTVGPAALHPRFEEFMKDAMLLQVGSWSHRERAYQKMHQHTVEHLRQLLSIPAGSEVLFTGSASEIWERILTNLVEHESYHLVNGSFSQKFYEYAVALKKYAHKLEKPLGKGFSYTDPEIPEFTELIAVTQNETSTGVQMRVADIHRLKRANSKRLMAVDMVSSAPYPTLDLSLIDTAFFSVQKAFGLPAGLGVWIANEACLAKAEGLCQKDDYSIGAHHDLPTLWKFAKKHQTPATPNVLGIYLLGRVAEDLNNQGVNQIRKDTDEKAKILYAYLEKSILLSPAVEEEEHRSKTVIVANTAIPSEVILDRLSQKNLIIGAGYGEAKSSQIRISNFPANSFEEVQQLISSLEALEP